MTSILQKDSFRARRFILDILTFIIGYGSDFMFPVLLEPCVGCVSDNREQPGAAVTAAKSFEKLERAQKSVLHDVFGIVLIPRQPSRKIIRRIQMRHN